MSKTEYKSTNQLMRHLRDNGIDISGKLQKQQLINTGYFHGYKAFRPEHPEPSVPVLVR